MLHACMFFVTLINKTPGWKETWITSIHKKDNEDDCSNNISLNKIKCKPILL